MLGGARPGSTREFLARRPGALLPACPIGGARRLRCGAALKLAAVANDPGPTRIIGQHFSEKRAPLSSSPVARDCALCERSRCARRAGGAQPRELIGQQLRWLMAILWAVHGAGSRFCCCCCCCFCRCRCRCCRLLLSSSRLAGRLGARLASAPCAPEGSLRLRETQCVLYAYACNCAPLRWPAGRAKGKSGRDMRQCYALGSIRYSPLLARTRSRSSVCSRCANVLTTGRQTIRHTESGQPVGSRQTSSRHI